MTRQLSCPWGSTSVSRMFQIDGIVTIGNFSTFEECSGPHNPPVKEENSSHRHIACKG